MHTSALMTDLYELTMLAGYQREGMSERPAAFDLFFRHAPYQGSYAVFAGLQPSLDYLAACTSPLPTWPIWRVSGCSPPTFSISWAASVSAAGSPRHAKGR